MSIDGNFAVVPKSVAHIPVPVARSKTLQRDVANWSEVQSAF